MTITREHGQYTLACDTCDEEVTDFDSFEDAKQHADDEQWMRTKERGEWQNICPACQGRK